MGWSGREEGRSRPLFSHIIFFKSPKRAKKCLGWVEWTALLPPLVSVPSDGRDESRIGSRPSLVAMGLAGVNVYIPMIHDAP